MNEDEYKRERELQKQRDRAEIANQLVRGGMLMNGGGAVSPLAFIQASIESERVVQVVPWAALAILAFVVGLSSAGIANYTRIRVSLSYNTPASDRKSATEHISWILQLLPIVFFLAGCLILAAAIFHEYGGPVW